MKFWNPESGEMVTDLALPAEGISNQKYAV